MRFGDNITDLFNFKRSGVILNTIMAIILMAPNLQLQ